jgi:hypothetical protein
LRLIILSLAAAAALAACGESTPPDAPESTAGAPAPAEPSPDPAVPAPTPDARADACGAAERQDWIGRARGDLPAAPAGADWRIYETGQPVTQDLRPDRLNIEIDPGSQSVIRLSCG